MNRKLQFAVGSFVIVAAVATLIYTAARETSAYFLTMDEYAAGAEAHEGKPLRLAGRVRDGSVQWNPRTLDLVFELQPIPPRADAAKPATDTSPAATVADPSTMPRLAVKYNGILPDMFAEGRDVIVEGRVTNRVLQADALLTTCPSKYEADVKPDEHRAGERSAGQLASG